MKTSKNFLAIVISIMIASISYGQIEGPEIEWQKSYGGWDNDRASSIIETKDGGYIVAGSSNSIGGDITNSKGDSDYWIVKIDKDGEIEWQKSYGGSGNDEAKSIIQTLDGGYIIAGTSTSADGDITNPKGNNDYWIVKINSIGILLWEKSYGGTGHHSNTGYSYIDEEANCIIQTKDGGYIIAGHSISIDGDITNSKGGYDYWIVKIDEDGNIEWEKNYGGNHFDFANCIIQTSDGGYIIAGHSYSYNGDRTNPKGDADYWVVKIDSIGNLLWEKSYGGSGSDKAHSIIQTSDGGYIIVGYSHSIDGDIINPKGGGYDYWIVKIDKDGEIEWQKSYGGSGNDEAKSIIQTSDGGYIIAGSSRSVNVDVSKPKVGYEYWVVKIDSIGTLLWEKSYGGWSYDELESIIQTSDGGYIIAGSSASQDGDISNPKGGYDYWIIKICYSDSTTTDSTTTSNAGLKPVYMEKFQAFPNPTINNITLTNLPTNSQIQLMDIFGNMLKQTKTKSQQHTISLQKYPKGVYFLKIISSDNTIQNKKIIRN